MNFLSATGGEATTILWLALPLIIGFVGYLLPRLDRFLAVGVALLSLTYGLSRVLDTSSLTLHLLDQVGVTLVVDSLSGFLILTNALVTLAVVLYSGSSSGHKSSFFYTQIIILHSAVNAVFVCADFMSLYVALEVISIATFLLIVYPRTDRSIWVGLRYLFVSNTAMLFYLIGAVLVYQANQSFAFAGLSQAPAEAFALLLLGLLTKGGIFVSGLWLPLTHAESETGVSALLSGSVINAGVFPLVRCAQMGADLQPLLGILAAGSAVLGVIYAIVETDTKRLLAFSTVSQLGFVLTTPAVAGFYALTHGLAKATLFLLAGNLPSRDLIRLRQTPIRRSLWIAVLLAALSMVGFPFLAGFSSKSLVLKDLPLWQTVVMNGAAVGTMIAMAHLIFLPVASSSAQDLGKRKVGFWLALILLLGGLIGANFVDLKVYTIANILKALLTIGSGGLLYILVFRRTQIRLPRVMERFEHLVGAMSLMLILLFSLVLS